MWKLDNNLRLIFGRLQSVAKKHGYILSLYGSVLTKGYSDRDLDIIAHPFIENKYNDKDGLIREFLTILKAKPLQSYNSEILDTSSITMETSDNMVVDLKILDIKIREPKI